MYLYNGPIQVFLLDVSKVLNTSIFAEVASFVWEVKNDLDKNYVDGTEMISLNSPNLYPAIEKKFIENNRTKISHIVWEVQDKVNFPRMDRE